MLKINNALIIDDQITLITDEQNAESINNDAYKSLKNIHDYFLNNSIPVSIINDLGISPLDALNKIQNIPRPDIVVMDLDLNSDGSVGDDDINLIGIFLKKLHDAFGNFILFIYSSQAEEWENIYPQILLEYPILSSVLERENTIVFEKFIQITHSDNENIAVEILNKKDRYFSLMLNNMDDFISKMWNKEVLAIGIISCILCYIVYFSFSNSDKDIFLFSLVLIIAVTFKYILSVKKMFKP